MIYRPQFKAHFEIEILKGEGVFVLSEVGHSVLTGRLFELVAPLINGSRSSDDIVEELQAQVPAAQVYYALKLLEQKGYLCESVETFPAGGVSALQRNVVASDAAMDGYLAGNHAACRYVLNKAAYRWINIACWCGADKSEPFHNQAVCGTPLKYVKCLGCGTVRAARYIADTNQLYQRNSRGQCVGRLPMSGFADRELHGIEIVRDGFSRPACEEQIEFIESVLRPRSVVDIGCGRAQPLVELRYRGLDWDHLYGYDIGFDIGEGQVPFDLAIMSHSLEHMLDPVTKLRHAITMVRDDGYVFIEVPAFNHTVGMLEVPHVWYWDRSALERLLHYVRLDVVKSEQPYHRRVMARPEARSDRQQVRGYAVCENSFPQSLYGWGII